MNAMPVQRVQQQQPFKPTAAACQEEEEFAFPQSNGIHMNNKIL